MQIGKNSSWLAAISIAGLVTLGGAAFARNVDSKSSGPKMADPPQSWTFADKADAWKRVQQQVGMKAPALKVKDWHGGSVESSDLSGAIVVYDFWATWCGPCIRSIPHNNELAKKYADQGVKVIGVCAVRGGEKMKETATKHNMEYPTALDDADATSKAFGSQWYPYYMIADRTGTIRAAGLTPDRVDDVVEALAKEQPFVKK